MVALVRGVHGLNGALRVEVLTDRPEDRFVKGSVLWREGGEEPLTIAAAEEIPDGPGWRLRFAEVSDRTAADRLRGAYLEAAARPDETLPRGAYYWHEVIGVHVRDLQDHDIGIVHDVYRVGEAEVFVVRGELYGEFDVPAVRAFIRIFAPKRGEIVVDVDALGLEPAKPPGPPRPPRTPKTRLTSRDRRERRTAEAAGGAAPAPTPEPGPALAPDVTAEPGPEAEPGPATEPGP